MYTDANAVAETDARKFVSSTEKTTWNNKLSGVQLNGNDLTIDANSKKVNIDLSGYLTKDVGLKNIILSNLQLTAVLGNGTTSTIGTIDVLGADNGLDDGGTIGQTLEDHERLINTLNDSCPKLVNGLIPSQYIPGSYDDIIEKATFTDLPTTGESGKLYVTTADDKVYRWSGSKYVQVNGGLVLGTTAETAAAGNHNHDSIYSKLGHNHDTIYSKLNHTHDVLSMDSGLGDGSDIGQALDNLSRNKSDSNHNHNGVYVRMFYSDTEPTSAVEGDVWLSSAA